MWNIEKIIRKGDYNYVIVKDHPNATSNGYVLHHRVVVENHLGRLLNTNEVVHHKNGNKLDNRLGNLEVLLKSEHNRLHGMESGRMYLEIKCPWCKNVYSRPYSQTHLGKKWDHTHAALEHVEVNSLDGFNFMD